MSESEPLLEPRTKTPEETDEQIQRIAGKLAQRALGYLGDYNKVTDKCKNSKADTGGLIVMPGNCGEVSIVADDNDIQPHRASGAGSTESHRTDLIINDDEVRFGRYKHKHEPLVSHVASVSFKTGSNELSRTLIKNTTTVTPIPDTEKEKNKTKIEVKTHRTSDNLTLGNQDKRDLAAHAFEHVRDSIHVAEAKRDQVRERKKSAVHEGEPEEAKKRREAEARRDVMAGF